MTSIYRHPGFLATVVIVVLTIASFERVATSSREELALANAHRQQGDIELAVEHYRRAIRWSYPMNPHAAAAVIALQATGRRLEAEGDRAGALSAWRALSGGLASTRFLYASDDTTRRNANAEISRLIAMDRDAAIDQRLSDEQLAADHRRLLDDDARPNPWWSTLLLLGMATWASALFLLARRGFDSDGRFEWASARTPLWGALVGLVSLGLGLLFA